MYVQVMVMLPTLPQYQCSHQALSDHSQVAGRSMREEETRQ